MIDRQRSILGIPADYRVAIVAGSDTGAFEMALWNLLGARGVDVLSWESFGAGWAEDIQSQLQLEDARYLKAPYGRLPDLSAVDWERDVVFTWNGTTSGVRVPHGDWISSNRKGLAICDATSAVFALELPWEKLDVITWSWQKVLGGEAAHGMLALSPQAVERLQTYVPKRPLPKLFRMTDGGRLNEALFEGSTINTPSLLCAEDARDALLWVEQIGGLKAVMRRVQENFSVLDDWVKASPWIEFLAERAEIRSPTSVCLSIVSKEFEQFGAERRDAFCGRIASLLEEHEVAYDIKSYAKAPPGLRIWCGATVEASDLRALTPWLDWAYRVAMHEFSVG